LGLRHSAPIIDLLQLLVLIQEFFDRHGAKHLFSTHLDIAWSATLTNPTVQRFDVYAQRGGRFFRGIECLHIELILREGFLRNLCGLLPRENTYRTGYGGYGFGLVQIGNDWFGLAQKELPPVDLQDLVRFYWVFRERAVNPTLSATLQMSTHELLGSRRELLGCTVGLVNLL
jgi:hypothetical protein